jgi:hypothetical protein
MTEMPGNIQAVWIEAFGPVELSESSVNTGLPGLAKDIRRG